MTNQFEAYLTKHNVFKQNVDWIPNDPVNSLILNIQNRSGTKNGRHPVSKGVLNLATKKRTLDDLIDDSIDLQELERIQAKLDSRKAMLAGKQ